MSFLYDIVPQYYKNHDTVVDRNIFGEIPELEGFLNAIDKAGLDPLKNSIEEILTYIDIDTIKDEYLPYFAYTFGYKWNYKLSAEIQRNILRNIIDIYKRKGTKFSIHFSMYQLDKSVSLYEPYKDIFVLNKSGLNRESNIVKLTTKYEKDSIKKIDTDSDGFSYVLAGTTLSKYNLDGIKYWSLDDIKIKDFTINHVGVQKDVLYFVNADDNKIYPYHLYKGTIDDPIECADTIYSVWCDKKTELDSNDNYVTKTTLHWLAKDDSGKWKIWFGYTSNERGTPSLISGILDLCAYISEDVITDVEYSDDVVDITHVYMDTLNNLVITFTGRDDKGKSSSFIHKYYKADISNNSVSSIYDTTYVLYDGFRKYIPKNNGEYRIEDFCFSYDLVDDNTKPIDERKTIFKYAITDITFNQNITYYLINDRFIYTLDSDNKTKPFIYSKIWKTIDNNQNQSTPTTVTTYDILLKESPEINWYYSTPESYNEDGNEKTIIDYIWNGSEWISNIREYKLNNNVWQLSYGNKDLSTDPTYIYKGMVHNNKELPPIRTAYNRYKVLDTNTVYYWNHNEWVKYRNININKDFGLTESEYPSNRILDFTIYKTIDNGSDEKITTYLYNIKGDTYGYILDKDFKVVSLNEPLPDITPSNSDIIKDRKLNCEVRYCDSETIFEYVEKLPTKFDILSEDGFTFTKGKKDDFTTLENKDISVYIIDNDTNNKDKRKLVYGVDYNINFDANRLIFLKPIKYNIDITIDVYSPITGTPEFTLVKKIPPCSQDIKIPTDIFNIFHDSIKIDPAKFDRYSSDIEVGKYYMVNGTDEFFVKDSNTSELIKEIYQIHVITPNGNDTQFIVSNSVVSSGKFVYTRVVNKVGFIQINNVVPGGITMYEGVKVIIKKITPTSLVVNKVITDSDIKSMIQLTPEDTKGMIKTVTSGIDLFIDGNIVNPSEYTFDLNTCTIKLKKPILTSTTDFRVDIYADKFIMNCLGIDNRTDILSDYIAVGFNNSVKIFNTNGVEIYSINTLYPVNTITNNLNDNMIYFSKNNNIYNAYYYVTKNGGVLTSKEEYSYGILVLSVSALTDEVFEILEYVRPAGWKILLEGKYNIVYNFNSKTYKDKDLQQKEIDTKYARGYPDNILKYKFLDAYREDYISGYVEYNPNNDIKYDVLVNYESDITIDPSIFYTKGIIYARKTNKSFIVEYDEDSGKYNVKNVENTYVVTNLLSELSNSSNYYTEQFLDSVQYQDPNNGSMNPICIVGKTFIDDYNLMTFSVMRNIYESMFEDIIISYDKFYLPYESIKTVRKNEKEVIIPVKKDLLTLPQYSYNVYKNGKNLQENLDYTIAKDINNVDENGRVLVTIILTSKLESDDVIVFKIKEEALLPAESSTYFTQFRNAIHYANEIKIVKEIEIDEPTDTEIEIPISDDMILDGIYVTLVGGGGGSSLPYNISDTESIKHISLGGSGAEWKYRLRIDGSELPTNGKLIIWVGRGGNQNTNGDDTYVKVVDSSGSEIKSIVAEGGKTSIITDTEFNVGSETGIDKVDSGKGRKAANMYKFTDTIQNLDSIIYGFDSVDSSNSIGNHTIFNHDTIITYDYATAGGASYGRANGYQDVIDNYGAGGCYNYNNGKGSNGYIKIEY